MEKGLIFTYALTYGGAVVSLVNPYVGLLIYILFSILKPETLWYWSVPEGNYSRIVAIALLIGWGLKGCGNWQFGKARGIVIAFVGYWTWGLISALDATNRTIALEFVECLTKILLPFLVGITTIDSVGKLKALAWTMLLGMGYLALELNQAYFNGYNRVHEVGHGGMDNNCVAIAMVAGVGLAFFLGMGAPRLWQSGVALVAALLMAHTVMLAFSRGGMLALIITGVLSFILLPKKPRHYLIFILAAAICVRLAGTDVLARFATSFADASERDSSAESRIVMWGNCLELIVRHPILGVGPDHFGQMAPQFGWPLGKQAHTLWLTVAAEMGLPGLAWILAFYGLCVKRLSAFLRKGVWLPDPWFADIARMVMAAIGGFMIAAQFVTINRLEFPFYIVLLGAAALKLASVPNGAELPADADFAATTVHVPDDAEAMSASAY